MSRLVVKTVKGPHEVKPSEKSVFICMCGLSKNQPFCDGSHMKTLDEGEGKMYEYDDQGKRQEMTACCCNENGCGECKK